MWCNRVLHLGEKFFINGVSATGAHVYVWNIGGKIDTQKSLNWDAPQSPLNASNPVYEKVVQYDYHKESHFSGIKNSFQI